MNSAVSWQAKRAKVLWRRMLRRAGVPSAYMLPRGRLDLRPDLAAFDIGRFTWGYLAVTDRHPGSTLRIGQFCSFAYGTHIVLGGEHRSDFVSTYRFPAYPPFSERFGDMADETRATKGDVVVGNDVWIGQQALIMSGATVGDGAIVGAGSVVRRDVPPYGIVAGNPARVVGYRFTPEQISELLEIKWWNWPLERVTSNMSLLMSDDIDAFIHSAKKAA